MIITRGIKFINVLKWSGPHMLWLLAFMSSIALLYNYGIVNIALPWLPVSVIGTAVSFYVGFKNNQSYDRMWEARKIWGGIVNDSRTWGMMVDSYISNLFSAINLSPEQLHSIKKRLIYRHVAWLYAHRSQLLIPTPWEHASQNGHTARTARQYQNQFGVGLYEDEATQVELTNYLQPDELEELINYKNTATQIINRQSRHLRQLREENLIDDFRLVQMEDVLRSFYTLQGKNERIKKFPLPRQYSNLSQYFVGIFIFLLPFSMMPELMNVSKIGVWLAVPITALIGWIFVMMEVVGDYSENPFQGMANDIPMLSLCRTIEIDLKEMLGEKDIPAPIQAKEGVLM